MILNKTTDEMINIKIMTADNFFNRFKGLMLKKDIDFAMLFSNLKDSSVHTHFMRFDLDIYFLDENMTLFEKATLAPWKFHRPKKPATYILETKKDRLKLKIGDKLEFL